MAEEAARSRLGRGLAALIGDVGDESASIERTRSQKRVPLEFAIIENVQRTDLNALEEAMGYQALSDEFGHAQDDIARIVGKSRSHVANTLRLLKLPDTVKAYLSSGKISAGHARALLSQPD